MGLFHFMTYKLHLLLCSYKTDIATHILQLSMHNLIVVQILPDGRQRLELKRANSWDYSLFNLQGLFKLANIGQYLGIDLWHYKTPSRSGLQTALDYLLPYALKKYSWHYRQIATFSIMNIVYLLCQATLHYPNNRIYIQAYKSMSLGKPVGTNIDTLLCICGIR